MRNELPPRDLRSVWKEQAVEVNSMSVDEIRTKARDYQNSIRWRNLREYLGVVIVLAGFGWFAWHAPSTDAKVGHSLVIAAVLYIAHQLHKTGSSTAVPADLGLMDGISFHRRELERQLQVYRLAWRWLLACVPGLGVLMVGASRQKPAVHLPAVPYGPFLVILGGWALLVLLVRARNLKKVRAIQQQLDHLNDAETLS